MKSRLRKKLKRNKILIVTLPQWVCLEYKQKFIKLLNDSIIGALKHTSIHACSLIIMPGNDVRFFWLTDELNVPLDKKTFDATKDALQEVVTVELVKTKLENQHG